MDFLKKFSNNNYISLQTTSIPKATLTNFPDKSTPNFTLTGGEQSFKIGINGLSTYTPPISKLLESQEIKFAEVANISFNVNDKKLVVTSTGNVHSPNFKDTIYFLFKLRNASSDIKAQSFIKADKTAISFATNLNDTPFEIGDIIEVSCYTSRAIEIKNYPNKDENTFIEKFYFNQDTYEGFFKIDSNGLQAFDPSTPLLAPMLPNTIKINDINNNDLIHIKFNTFTRIIQTFTFAKYADLTSEYPYVIAKLYDDTNTLTYTATLPSNNLPTNVSIKLNLHLYSFNSILDLTYDYRAISNILVTNLNDKNHIAEHTNERYKITPKGLEFIPIFLPNIITIKDINNTTVAIIEFDLKNNKLKATSFNNIADSSSNYEYFRISFYHLTDRALGYPIYTASLNSNANPLAFVNALNTILFKEDNIVKITCNTKALNKINISNFPNEGDIHLFSTETEYYKVTKNGLVTFTPQSILANDKISVRKASNLYADAFTLSFDPNSMLIKATAIDESINDGGVWQTAKAFEYTFKNKNGETIKTDYIYAADPGIIGRNGSLVALASGLNNTPFSYGESIEFYAPYKYYTLINKTFMSISNMPFESNEYWKFNDTETIIITPLGLVLSSNSPLGNASLLQNIIIVNDSNNKSTVQFYFDISSNKLLVSTSSFKVGNISPSGGDYFVFTLKYSSGEVRTIATIKENETPEKFVAIFNNHGFQFGDTITMECPDLNKISIQNYPKYKSNYSPLVKTEKFIITKLGLVSSLKLLKNEISFLGHADKLIAKIYFSLNGNKLIVKSTGITAHTNLGDNEYFAIVLKNDSGTIIKEASVKGNENGNNFATTLNETSFQLGYSITIRFKEKLRFLVSNFPNEDDTYKSPNDIPKFFFITENGLVFSLLKNIIRFLGYGNNLIASIQFNSVSKELVVFSTGITADSNFGNSEYFAIVLKDTSGNTIREASVKGNENANAFATALNGISLQENYSIIARFKEKDKFLISNFPNEGDTYQSLNDLPKGFFITENGLVLPLLKNIVSFLGFDNALIATIQFDPVLKQLVVFSTSLTANSNFGNSEYFAIVLKDDSGNIIKEASVTGNENANAFATALNGTPYEIGYSITARFKEKDKFLVSNFPNEGDTYQSLNDLPKAFFITKNGLVLSLLKNVISFLGFNNDLIATIQFDSVLKQLVVLSTGITADSNFGNNEYFSLALNDDSETVIKEASVTGNENANAFATTLNATSFQFDYYITARFREKENFSVSNFPNEGDTYKSPNDLPKSFFITKNGLTLIPPKISNKIIINKPDGSNFGMIAFNNIKNKFVLSGFKEQYDLSSNYKVLEFKLYHSNLSRVINITLNSQDDPATFFNAINNKAFGDNFYLELGYSDESKNNINIANFPDTNNIHIPTVIREYYKINLSIGLTTHTPRLNPYNFMNGTTIVVTLSFDIINKKLIFNQLVDSLSSAPLFSIITKCYQNNITVKVFEFDSQDDPGPLDSIANPNLFKRKFRYNGLEPDEFDYAQFTIDINSKEQRFNILGLNV